MMCEAVSLLPFSLTTRLEPNNLTSGTLSWDLSALALEMSRTQILNRHRLLQKQSRHPHTQGQDADILLSEPVSLSHSHSHSHMAVCFPMSR
jgi:hypothetical protein